MIIYSWNIWCRSSMLEREKFFMNKSYLIENKIKIKKKEIRVIYEKGMVWVRVCSNSIVDFKIEKEILFCVISFLIREEILRFFICI